MPDSAEQAVLRIFLDEDSEGVLGTAFVVAPGLALTCAHVLEGLEGRAFRLIGRTGRFSACGATRLPPDPAVTDLALLPIDPEAMPLLACAASPDPPRRIRARGYSPTATGPGGRELRFEPRDRAQVRYDGRTRSYLVEAFDLIGDPAEKGFSGSPLIDADSGAAVAVLSGGDRGRERYWAVPLHAAADAWPELAHALGWNDTYLPRYGALTNRIGALEICKAQVGHEIARMRDIKKYDQALSVARTRIDADLQEFRAALAIAMAIVGEANTGKTWLLCDAVLSSAHAPMVLLAAADLPPDHPPSLPDFLTRSLEAACPHEVRETVLPSPTSLAKALTDGPGPLTIALDGINEALDVRHFLSRWLPEALAWCRDAGVKLVFTTRPEPWPAIARAIPRSDMLFFRDTSGSKGLVRAEQRHTFLEDFTGEEAEIAVRNYRLDLTVADALGRSPLLFRVAADLGLNAAEARVGRYRLLDDFADSQIRDATKILGARPSGMVLVRVRRLAGELWRDGGGSLAFDEAVSILDDEPMVWALIEAGLLSRHTGSVRFAYDQVGEAMTPAPAASAVLFPLEALADGPLFRRSVVGLLRLEADGDEPRFNSGLERLGAALTATAATAEPADWWGILEALTYLIQSLPSSRVGAIDAIVALATGYVDDIVDDGAFSRLVAMVEHAPLDVSRRCEVLLSLAPWGDAWPFRYKDWLEEDRRRWFEGELTDPVERNVASALDGLHGANRDFVRPLLVRALGDETLLDKGASSDSRREASIASLTAGLLFHRHRDDFEALLDLLFRTRSRAHGVLLQALATELPQRTFAHTLMHMSNSRTNLVALSALDHAARRVDSATRVRAIPELEAMLPEPGELGLAAASALRQIDPGHLAAWDRIAEAPRQRYSGDEWHPVPPARFDRALAMAEAWPEAGLDWMRVNDGPEDQQIAMVERARNLLVARATRLFLFGRLVEDKIRWLRRTSEDRFRPWLALACALTECGDVETRRCLIYGIFSDPVFLCDPDIADLADRLYRQDLSESEAGTIVSKVMAFLADDFSLWREHFARARSKHRDEADLEALNALSGRRYQRDRAEMLVSFWRNLPQPAWSSLGAKVLGQLNRGQTIDAVFAQYWRRLME